MAIKVSGVNVIDNERNANVGILTATKLDIDPSPLSFSPSDGAGSQAIDTNIQITYNNSIAKGSGDITLRNGSASGSVIETIAVSSGNVTISGAVATINPSSDLPNGTNIFVVVPAGAFTHATDGLNGETALLDSYDFTTSNISAQSFSPSDGATSQSMSTNIQITFDTNIAKGSGDITLRNGSASGSVIETIDVTSGAVSVSSATATINPTSDLPSGTDVYVVVDSGCFTDTSGGGPNVALSSYNFTTAALAISSFSPTDGSTNQNFDSNVVLTFNTDIAANTGNITIRSGSASGTILETIDVTSGNVSISGTQATINPSSNFPADTSIYVVIPANAFLDTRGGGNLSEINNYNFTIGSRLQLTSPYMSPADNSTGQTTTTNITFYFDNTVSKGSGSITIRDGSGSGTVLQTIAVSSSAVSVSGSQATINPPSDLPFDTDVYIVLAENNFMGGPGGGNTIQNNLNFTTESDIQLGDSYPSSGNNNYNGGNLICQNGGYRYIVAPSSAEIWCCWYSRNYAANYAQQETGCSGWFVPSLSQHQNPGYCCRQYWENFSPNSPYWVNQNYSGYYATYAYNNSSTNNVKTRRNRIRAFRTISY